MKRIFTILAAVLMTATVWAQSPEKMSYQAVIRNSSNALVTSTNVGMQISILQGSASGTVVYVETLTPTTNANGLVSIEIGGGAGFSTIDWANGPYFIKTETDPTGGTSYSITGTSQLLSVPYALHAKTAESITGTEDLSTLATKTALSDSIAQVRGEIPTAANGSETKVTAGTNVTVTGSGTTASPYVVNATTGGGGFTHYVGELYGGGIIVSVWKVSGVEHGLIASLTDQSASLIWTTVVYQSVTVPGGATSPIDGLANSNAIVAQAGAGTTYAAGLCRAYSTTGDGGLNDWYLPATWELNQCYNAAFVVNTILGATSGFQFADYWSSTEFNGNFAWLQSFSNGHTGNYYKGSNYRVRAVRRF